MKFGLLPNEILIECFEYLNAPDIFYSFDRLNYRFYKLIRSIPLYLDCKDIRESTFDEFCTMILLNPEIRNQIYSLQLSNNDTCGQIQTFLSFFSLIDFPRLRSISLLQIEKNNVEKLQLMLPFIPTLRCFRMIDFDSKTEDILSVSLMSQLKTLHVSKMALSLPLINQILSINNLTLSYCSLATLCELLIYTPMLKYLDARVATGNNERFLTADHAVQLKTLIVRDFLSKLDGFETFLKFMTPNLKMLVMTTVIRNDVIDADRWERLITSSLLQLKVFKFKFSCSRQNKDDDIIDKFRQFQNDFWHQQHHWYTAYSLSKYSAVIYTIPYLLNTYTLSPYTHKYFNTSIGNSHIFGNVRELILYQEAITPESPCYFPNVISLAFENQLYFETVDNHFLKLEAIESLKMIVNLSHIKHLTISSTCRIETTTVLLELLKQTKQLSSMTIDPDILSSICTDHELCIYLSKMIKKLDIYKRCHLFVKTSQEIEQFCEVFSNLEQLKRNIKHSRFLLILLTGLSKLLSMKVSMQYNDYRRIVSWFEGEAPKLNIMVDTKNSNKCTNIYERELFIRTGRNTN